MTRSIGKTRTRLTGVLVSAFAEIGVTARFDPQKLRPAQGYWRTSVYADVYRWEGSGEQLLEDGTWMTISVDSWDTMTDCVRYGCTVQRDRGAVYDAHANKSRTHPMLLRAENRRNLK